MDIVEPQRRSAMMANIKSKNTRPEVELRSFLHHSGIRFRIHSKALPGHPDIVIKKYNAIIFVNGCFWHHHSNCRFAYIPKSRTDFWTSKFEQNIARDKVNVEELEHLGWRVLTVWECEMKTIKSRNDKFRNVLNWIVSGISES